MLARIDRKHLRPALWVVILLLLATVLGGCASRTRVRHLDANLSVLTPGMSEKEVRGVMGPPDRRRQLADGSEEWLYLQAHQSWLKRTRLLGAWLGRESFQQATVLLRDGQLVDAVYHGLNRREFLELGGEIP
ncbi:MAG: hypothetical protein U5J62_11865 [Desulfurivibrio sp.]|nr:hypothetical protein [Desulfurivibrio sp.]